MAVDRPSPPAGAAGAESLRRPDPEPSGAEAAPGGDTLGLLWALESASTSEGLLRAIQQRLRRRTRFVAVHPAGEAVAGVDPRLQGELAVRLGEATLGWLLVEGRPLDPQELTAARLACRILATLVWQEQGLASQWQALLDGGFADGAALERMFAYYRWPGGAPIAVFAARCRPAPWESLAPGIPGPDSPPAGGPIRTGRWELVRGAEAKEEPVEALLFARLDSCAVFLAVEDQPADRRALQRLAQAVRLRLPGPPGPKRSVGFGGVAASPAAVPYLWRRACQLLEWGEAALGPGCLADESSVGMTGLMLQHVPDDILLRYARQKLAPLLAREGPGDGHLLGTLEVLLECGGNANAASRRLFVHYNTLRHRLKRIEVLLDVDLSVLAVRMDLWACILVLRLCRPKR